jgi:hypothetical protein
MGIILYTQKNEWVSAALPTQLKEWMDVKAHNICPDIFISGKRIHFERTILK